MDLPLNCGCAAPATPYFQPSQIIGLEHKIGCLYSEVVQVVKSRQSCWVRPLILVLRAEENQTYNNSLASTMECYDLRHDSDLLLPLTLFRAALDVEVLPWLTDLYADNYGTAACSDKQAAGHTLFRDFIQQIWQAHPEVFQAPSRLGKA